MKLEVDKWKFFYLKDICKITMGNKLDYAKMSFDNPTINFVGRSAENNGVSGQVDLIEGITPYKKGCLTIALGGSLGSTYVQSRDFYTSQNVSVLEFAPEVSKFSKLFISTVIMNECKYKYFPFGRELNTHIRKDFGFNLPATPDGTPDWGGMDEYIKSLNYKLLTTSNVKTLPSTLMIEKWADYKLGDLFIIKKGKRLTSDDQTDGTTPYIGAIYSNNGIANLIGQKPIYEGNSITLSYNGSVGEAFYQAKPFWATDDVNILYANGWELNKYIALFVTTVIKANRYRFSYGRKWTLEKMKETLVKLPSTNDGSPDFEYMENYIKSLPFSDRM